MNSKFKTQVMLYRRKTCNRPSRRIFVNFFFCESQQLIKLSQCFHLDVDGHAETSDADELASTEKPETNLISGKNAILEHDYSPYASGN